MIDNWRKSTHSEPGGSCVEFGEDPETGARGVRDSKHKAGPHLEFTRVARRAFVAGVASGRLAGPQR